MNQRTFFREAGRVYAEDPVKARLREVEKEMERLRAEKINLHRKYIKALQEIDRKNNKISEMQRNCMICKT